MVAFELHGHPDGKRDGLRRVLHAGVPVLAAARDGELFPLRGSLAELLGAGGSALVEAAARALSEPPLRTPATLLAPVDRQEVWAGGVTYRRSADAREQESVAADVYTRVYDAERPELFLKATPARVPAPGAPLRIRADSGWDVPEPELALVLDAAAQIVGYLAADDVSSRAIEGANPLYLPQAKIYDDALGLSGTIVLASGDDSAVRTAAIELSIHRAGAVVFAGSTSVAEMKRSFEELVAALFVELSHPAGAVLLTGTGIVPPDDFSLAPGDAVRIAIEGVGVLEHEIYRQEPREHVEDADR
ncbi:MAG: fumarylacetoacetate hydrolase family protein [Actinomycetota bacterium]|nr:fumarylacetoacetate hydrolase family protein [Actinomycetota bacterium]